MDKIKGLLCDITGVLYDSGPGGGAVIPGSIAAVKKLKAAKFPLRFCSNETQSTRKELVEKLRGFGYELEETDICCPAPAVVSLMKKEGIRPHLLIHPNSAPDFDGVDTSNPNAVVLGDAGDAFSFANLNAAFRVLMAQGENARLFSLGQGRYYKDTDGLTLDVGAFKSALEFSTGLKATVVGKPDPSFFGAALDDIGVSATDAAMIGDDLRNDVGGAQKCGLQGFLVRSGKYQPSDETSEEVKPNGIFNNLEEFVDALLATKK